MRFTLSPGLAAPLMAACFALASPAQAVPIGGVEFPEGAVSFADAVVSYAPVLVNGTQPTAPHRDPTRALGVPDYAGDTSCASGPTCTFVSLGDGGTLTLQFTDNVLTGSDNNNFDLWIFEVGPDVEDMFVEVSTDGSSWLPVGKVGGSTAGVDLDAFGYGLGHSFSFVRLRDDPDLDGQNGATVGADIDAVGAISTRRVSLVSEPDGLTLVLTALAGAMALGLYRRSPGRHPCIEGLAT